MWDFLIIVSGNIQLPWFRVWVLGQEPAGRGGGSSTRPYFAKPKTRWLQVGASWHAPHPNIKQPPTLHFLGLMLCLDACDQAASESASEQSANKSAQAS